MDSKIKLKPIIGWREWVDLPDLGIQKIKAKVDTGAKSSALHAENIEVFKKGNRDRVRFTVFPIQKTEDGALALEADLLGYKFVRSSSGHEHLRPIIKTHISLGPYLYELDVTLAKRDLMGFRLLLGRDAVAGHFLVNPARSYFFKQRVL